MSTTTPDQGLWFLNGHSIIKLSQADNADRISLIESRLPFGDAPPRHIHHGEDEVFYLLDGEMRFEVDGRPVTARRGDAVLAPKGSRHGFRVISPEGAHVLTITRGGFEAMVRSVSRPAGHAGLPDWTEPTPDLQAQLTRACAAQNIEIVGPPIA